MKKLFSDFKELFKTLGSNKDLINMYLVFVGVRSACLIENPNIFYLMPKKANLEIHFGRYPGFPKNRDYPLVCLTNSWVSRYISKHDLVFTEDELGLYLGYNCYYQEWKNLRINRYEIKYILIDSSQHSSDFREMIYAEACSVQPDLGMITRAKFKAKEMNMAVKLMNPKYNVKCQINFIPTIHPVKSKRKIDKFNV